ncbi:MAG: LysR family transcriptional regulator [Mesorhizobium sp.]|uniref:LysR family transcriptional regulator n=1 Tax=Mesorhizobium sp. TaxID=1871066 RepID=UPI000FE895EF|nr:LysR family transcriptional regulator [Mesorhizobium sp.]RWH31405.1 MAG: LysR family transcriptional regulator [Mesorhizobium sp.]RWH38647.1 MAG: LysR family transcriptional regulator [Mesorhizobium sp.]TIM67182.1 MAG: LysR family transcriptional regulator [Mesorhizobium sp.]TIO05230.1 MAG: LysR family transcriptional regulator [Mesorhizobium sp.]TIR61887.1 MAG: LysR family transcriptional regulator [Mesorhizobium sp.]
MEEISGRNSKAGFRCAQSFREIIRTGSTRRAARELGITQSAVSQHLKLFEEAVGERLFARDHRGLVPTTRAIELYNRVDRYFETLSHIEREITDSFSTKRNGLTIAAPHILSLRLIPKIILALDNLDPSLEFHFRAQRYDEIAQSMMTGEADIGISRLPLDERFFEWQIVAESKSVCVVHPDHRLAQKEIITLEDISNEPLIVLEREYTSNKLGLLSYGQRKIPLRPKIHSDTIGLDVSFVAHGIGIAIDNEFIARQYQMFGVKIVPFQPARRYEYVVFWRRGSDYLSRQSAILDTFVEVIKRERLLSNEAPDRICDLRAQSPPT